MSIIISRLNFLIVLKASRLLSLPTSIVLLAKLVIFSELVSSLIRLVNRIISNSKSYGVLNYSEIPASTSMVFDIFTVIFIKRF